MIISSEITGQTYKTVDACLAAEKLFKEEQERKEQEKKALAKKKDEAYKKAMDACDEYLRLCGIELDYDNNGYTMKYYNDGSEADSIFEDILRTMLK